MACAQYTDFTALRRIQLLHNAIVAYKKNYIPICHNSCGAIALVVTALPTG